MSFRKLMLAGLALVCTLAPFAAADGKKATVTIVNKSDWRIDHFYLSSSDSDQWGPDQLGEDVIEKGEQFKLTDIPCNTWDVKVVDEDGDECIIAEVDLCKADAQWTITNKELLACQAASE